MYYFDKYHVISLNNNTYCMGRKLNCVNKFKYIGLFISDHISYLILPTYYQIYYKRCNERKFDFVILSSDVKLKCMYIVCMTLYVNSFYTAWRKCIRVTWDVPYQTIRDFLHVINFLFSCHLCTNNALVKSVIVSAIQCHKICNWRKL